MRRTLVALALGGCAEPNPLYVPPTGSSTTDAGTSTAPPLTTEPMTTGTVTTGTVTTDVLTSAPITSGSNPVTGPVETTGSTGMPLPLCNDSPDDLLPYFELRQVYPMDDVLPEGDCGKLVLQIFAAKYITGPDLGFTGGMCPGNVLPFPFRLQHPGFIPPPNLYTLPACVEVAIDVHPYDKACYLKTLTVSYLGEVFAWGEFGVPPVMQQQGFGITAERKEPCLCDGCCDLNDPGQYKFVVAGLDAYESDPPQALEFPDPNKPHTFFNLRSHVHSDCTDPGVPAHTARHLDYFMSRIVP